MNPPTGHRPNSTERTDSPYEFRDERRERDNPDFDQEERDVVIVDGQAMSFRVYRR